MILNKRMLKELEATYKKHFSEDFRQYLLVKYGQEPFPYEFSEQDLYTNIDHDIRVYDAGELDVTVKSPSERWLEEREYLQNLYIAKAGEAQEFADYVAELERILSAHGLESAQMVDRLVALAEDF